MDCYTLFDAIDIITFIILCVTSWYSYKIYKLLPAQMVTFLFIGFILSAFLQLGFIVISFMPMEGEFLVWNRFIGELTVALRIIPIAFIMIGKINLYNVVTKYINGNGGSQNVV